MLNYSYTPKLKDFFSIFKKLDSINLNNFIIKNWCKNNKNCYKFFSRSSWILFYLCFFKKKNKSKLVIWLPNYYCSETVILLEKLDVQILYYDLNKDFTADLNSLKNLSLQSVPDIILFCNYFGKSCFISYLKDLSLKFNSWLVEDCAHCISPDDNLGKFGDIAFFSPYKFFPVPNGAIMISSTNFLKKNDLNFFLDENKFEFHSKKILKDINFKKKNNFLFIMKWSLKKLINIFNINFPTIYNFDYSPEIQNIGSFNHPMLDGLSLKILFKYLKNINFEKEKRKKMSMLWYRYLNQFSIFNEEDFKINSFFFQKVPYFFLVSSDEDKILEKYLFLKKKKIPVLTWPSLPKVIKEKQFCRANQFRKSFFFLPLHDQARTLISKINVQTEDQFTNENFNFNKISDNFYESLYSEMKNPNLLQSLNYGNVLKSLNNIEIERYLITSNKNEKVAILQVLKKNFLFFNFYKINRGPIFFENIKDNIKIKIIIQLTMKFKSIFKFLSFSPELFNSPENILLNFNKKKVYFKQPSWNSFVVNLFHDISIIKKNLMSSWRSQLNQAEKNNLIISSNNDIKNIKNLIKLNDLNSTLKNFKTINSNFLLTFLLNSKNIILNSYKNEELIASVCVVIHGDASTYLLGWSNNAGRKYYATNLLLWEAIKILKKKKVNYLDLGGFDKDMSIGIYKFKKGLGGSEYKLVGKYQ